MRRGTVKPVRTETKRLTVITRISVITGTRGTRRTIPTSGIIARMRNGDLTVIVGISPIAVTVHVIGQRLTTVTILTNVLDGITALAGIAVTNGITEQDPTFGTCGFTPITLRFVTPCLKHVILPNHPIPDKLPIPTSPHFRHIIHTVAIVNPHNRHTPAR
jgi:hypothetical protein